MVVVVVYNETGGLIIRSFIHRAFTLQIITIIIHDEDDADKER